MTILKYFLGSLVFFGAINAIFSYIAKDVLKSNGYEVNYLFTQFFYEIRTLKKICLEQRKYYPILIAYKTIFILLIINLLAIFIIIFIRIFLKKFLHTYSGI